MSKTDTGSLPGYETTLITRAEMTDSAVQQLRDKLTAIVGEFGGKVVITEDWGKRKLAYPIQKEQRGQYTYVVYTGKQGVVHEIERNLRIHEHVLRFLSVSLGTYFDGEAYAKRREELQALAKRREEERQARREERMAERRGEYRERGEYRDRGDRDGYRKESAGIIPAGNPVAASSEE